MNPSFLKSPTPPYPGTETAWYAMQKANVSAVETKCITFSRLKISFTMVQYCVEKLPNDAFIQS